MYNGQRARKTTTRNVDTNLGLFLKRSQDHLYEESNTVNGVAPTAPPLKAENLGETLKWLCMQ